MPEILFILVLALLIFGPKRLPQMGRMLGRGLREFRRATNELKRTVETEIEADETPKRPQAVQRAPAPAPAAAATEVTSGPHRDVEGADGEAPVDEPPAGESQGEVEPVASAGAVPREDVGEPASDAAVDSRVGE